MDRDKKNAITIKFLKFIFLAKLKTIIL